MKKYMPYIIIGVPALIGVLFIVKAMRRKNEELKVDDNQNTNTTDTQGGGGTTTPKKDFPLRRGSKGDLVKSVQIKLGGLTADGDFGKLTEAKVKEFQKANSLVADGVVGAKTWKALFGVDYPAISISGGRVGGLKNNPYATTKFPVDNSQLGI
jgi:peptidoglycan hydrolase-like protein with peptidoglycan-binding domain